MTSPSSDIEMRPAAPAPSRTGQATAVEQARAVAEVEAAIVVALRHPRNIERAVADMHRSCATRALAERAFWRYKRGEHQLTGPSIKLARELARCWGNFQHGLVELRRDDQHGQSEMLAFAWDVQTNSRSQTTFIVPHLRDRTEGGPVRLTATRDIYENNANMGGRRLREMILDELPVWYVEDAISACYATLEGNEATDGTLEERRAKVIDFFRQVQVTVAQLEQKLGAPRDHWSPADLAQLHVIYTSLKRGEVTKAEEFGAATPRVAAADLTGPPDGVDPATGEKPATGKTTRDSGQGRQPRPPKQSP